MAFWTHILFRKLYLSAVYRFTNYINAFSVLFVLVDTIFLERWSPIIKISYTTGVTGQLLFSELQTALNYELTFIKDTDSTFCIPVTGKSHQTDIFASHFSKFNLSTFSEFVTQHLPCSCWRKLKHMVLDNFDFFPMIVILDYTIWLTRHWSLDQMSRDQSHSEIFFS